jgi:predicted NBD/HSP70 family sugar kinase
LAGRHVPPTDEATAAVFADARAGDPVALAAARGVAEPLGRAIASLVNVLNPHRVLLGGFLSEVLDIARPELQQALDRFALHAHVHTVQLTQPRFGSDSALLGAAEVAFTSLLADPVTAAALSA